MAHASAVPRLLVGLAASVAALLAPARVRAADDEQVIRALDAAWSRALEAKDLEGTVAHYADDAVLLPPDAPLVEGKPAIRERFARRLATAGYHASFVTTRVTVAGAVAYELGAFHVTAAAPGGAAVARVGKHLVVWEKRAGRWQVTAESLNFDAP
jgi:uncharacterized protein (TIGR02246 family)